MNSCQRNSYLFIFSIYVSNLPTLFHKCLRIVSGYGFNRSALEARRRSGIYVGGSTNNNNNEKDVHVGKGVRR